MDTPIQYMPSIDSLASLISSTTVPLPTGAAKDTSEYLTVTNTQIVAVGSTSTQSAAIGSTTTKIVISTTTDCWIAIGTNPTAIKNTANNIFLGIGNQSYPIGNMLL